MRVSFRSEFQFRLFILAMVIGTLTMHAQAQSTVSLMPLPAKMQVGSGVLKIDEKFAIGFSGYREARLDRAAERSVIQLGRETGLVFVNRGPVEGANATLIVTTDHESKPVQELGEDESYQLEVTPSAARLHAANPLGLTDSPRSAPVITTCVPFESTGTVALMPDGIGKTTGWEKPSARWIAAALISAR